ncbi:MAG: hypothetical protein IKZ00_03330 [Bacteroidaceae bacterium]|nr:hypothetical protein [Bacteroidaceae bacterium]
MTKFYLEASMQSPSVLFERITNLTKLVRLPERAVFYASELGFSGAEVASLHRHNLIKEVPGMEKEAFIPVGPDDMYKRVKVKAWTLNVPTAVLREELRNYCLDMAAAFSALVLTI